MRSVIGLIQEWHGTGYFKPFEYPNSISQNECPSDAEHTHVTLNAEQES